ncbi:MAG: hypothetical protein SFZ24_09435, partial [Planctomycetota bacterium]|nr:hypothetical protein [Planctomycetota bacterium]
MPTLKDVSSRATIRCLPVGLACLLALAAASCGPAPRGAGPVEEGAVASAGQDGPVADPTAERLALMAQAQENSRVSVDRPAGGVRRLPREQAAPELPGEPADAGAIAAGEPESASGPAPAGAGAEPGASDSAGPTTVPAGPPPLSREDVLRALASELESQASASDSPVGALIRLAALELVSGASA